MILVQVWEDLSPLVVSDQTISTFSYIPAMRDHTVECCVLNTTHLQALSLQTKTCHNLMKACCNNKVLDLLRMDLHRGLA